MTCQLLLVAALAALLRATAAAQVEPAPAETARDSWSGFGLYENLTTWLERFHGFRSYWSATFDRAAQVDHGPRYAPIEGTTGVPNPYAAGSTRRNDTNGGDLRHGFSSALEGLKFGLHGFTGNDSAKAAGHSAARMLGGKSPYPPEDWGILSEYYGFGNLIAGHSSAFRRSWAAYAQVGKTIRLWTVYGRHERAWSEQADLHLVDRTSTASYGKSAISLRFDLGPRSALQLEFDRVNPMDRDSTGHYELWFQYSLRF